MNASKQAAWLFCALLALACSGFYFASSTPINRLDDNILSKAADIIITNLTVTRFDEAGRVAHYLKTPEVQHIPENNVHLFKSPYMTLAQADHSTWEVKAQHAKALNGGKQITFMHDVIIHQNKSDRAKESTLKTEELNYFPKEKLAKTSLAVSFEQAGSIVRAKGMNAFLNEKRVQLLSQARATFEPKHG